MTHSHGLLNTPANFWLRRLKSPDQIAVPRPADAANPEKIGDYGMRGFLQALG